MQHKTQQLDFQGLAVSSDRHAWRRLFGLLIFCEAFESCLLSWFYKSDFCLFVWLFGKKISKSSASISLYSGIDDSAAWIFASGTPSRHAICHASIMSFSIVAISFLLYGQFSAWLDGFTHIDRWRSCPLSGCLQTPTCPGSPPRGQMDHAGFHATIASKSRTGRFWTTAGMFVVWTVFGVSFLFIWFSFIWLISLSFAQSQFNHIRLGGF